MDSDNSDDDNSKHQFAHTFRFNSKHQFTPTFDFKLDRYNLNYSAGGNYNYNISNQDNIHAKLNLNGKYNFITKSNDVKNIYGSLGYDHRFKNNSSFNVESTVNLDPNYPRNPIIGGQVNYRGPNLDLFASADKVYDYPAYNVRGRITADNGMFIGGEATKKNDSPRKTKFYFGFDFLKFFGFK